MSPEDVKNKFPYGICNKKGGLTNKLPEKTGSNDSSNKSSAFVAYRHSTHLDDQDYSKLWIADSETAGIFQVHMTITIIGTIIIRAAERTYFTRVQL